MGTRTDSEHAPAEKTRIQKRIDAMLARVLRWRAVRTWLLYAEKHGPALADGITYRALFSVFAAVLLGFSVAGLWLSGNRQALAALVRAVDAAVPGLIGSDGLIDPTTIAAPTGLSIAGAASLVGLIGAALGAIGSLRIALRTLAGRLADDVQWYWVILRNLGLAAGIGVGFALSAAATVIGSFGIDRIAVLLGAEHAVAAAWTERIVSLVVVFALDTALVASVFAVLSGVRADARTLWAGAAIGGAGLLVLQQLSTLFVRSASANPLLASFAALIALLLWLNLSSQVVLLAGAWIITGVEDGEDRTSGQPRSFAERRLDRAERLLAATTAERDAAREALKAERGGTR
ncbi:YihY/virulence factor BrkB family protein [Microbacterium azadirachtae]|uniref:YihY/virulence factor BrkB family protein n=1 Tax=Microbacterium azadirachtae TaxID=582680 RepID=UPI00088A4B48|nr:YihY/virulence factor BrkB family protein [Microbacterium azadirachtae]SDM47635.1 membrane protein [Microbacterium azadirachtae]SEG60170.1 membrane protein [Microbacterium azadirachtae]SEG61676.1 membrane protein [Microbacterium azadirachtae]